MSEIQRSRIQHSYRTYANQRTENVNNVNLVVSQGVDAHNAGQKRLEMMKRLRRNRHSLKLRTPAPDAPDDPGLTAPGFL